MSFFGGKAVLAAHASVLRKLDFDGREFPMTAEAGDQWEMPDGRIMQMTAARTFASRDELDAWAARWAELHPGA